MEKVKMIALHPVRLATSKPAQQTYLNTALLAAASSILGFAAVVAYVLFYWNFIPTPGVEREVYLQFGSGPNPYAFIPLGKTLVSQQPYSIHLALSLPHSPTNTLLGNFMLDLSLLSPAYTPTILASASQLTSANLYTTSTTSDGAPVPAALSHRAAIPDDAVLHSSRRPALLTYHPRLLEYTSHLLAIPWHILGLRKRTAEVLRVSMVEDVSFARGWRNVPDMVYIEVQTVIPPDWPERGEIQVYDMKLHVRAQLEGLRWIMYNHRILSFIVFTFAFWAAEVVGVGIAWLLWTYRSSALSNTDQIGLQKQGAEESRVRHGDAQMKLENGDDGTGRDEDTELSDTERSFPTYGRQSPLRYTAPARIKSEDEEEEARTAVLEETRILPLDAADDEAEGSDEDGVDVSFGGDGRDARGMRSDSGIGTSFSEGGGVGGLSRRKSGRR